MTGRVHPLAPLRSRNFRLLWIGAGASLLGDGVFLVTIAWQAYSLTHRPSGLALLGVCGTLSQLAAVITGGVISDRCDRRRVLLTADLARMAAAGTVAVLVLAGTTRLWHLVSLAVIYGLGAGIAAPAFDALLPSLVPASDLEQANALEQFLRPAMLRLAGPGLGGVLLAAGGTGMAFLFDAATFAVSAGALWQMRVPRRRGSRRPPARPSVLADAAAGLRYVRSEVWLWGSLGSATLAFLLFIGPAEVLLPLLLREEMRGTAQDLGLVLAAGGLGAAGVAVVIGLTGLPRRQLRFMYAAWTLGTLAVAAYGVAQARWEFAVACAIFNGLEVAGTIAWATTKQRMVPAELLGRVSSLEWFFSLAGLPLSYALTVPAAACFGPRPTLIGAGVLGALATAAALLLPGMRAADGVAKPVLDGYNPKVPASRPVQREVARVELLPGFARLLQPLPQRDEALV